MRTDRYKGFTLVEILTAVAIIAILLGVLMPALSEIKKLARTTRQKAQNNSIEIGLDLYKNEKGEYPPSHGWILNNTLPPPYDHENYQYSGAQILAEAMFGYDLLGFDPNSKYDPLDADKVYADANNRKGPYLDRTNIGVYEPNHIFKTPPSNLAERKGHMICDSFSFKSEKIGKKKYNIGTPVLYFRANLSPVNTQLIPNSNVANLARNIYNYVDNYYLLNAGRMVDGKNHPICPFNDYPTDAANGNIFYRYIHDPMIPKPTGTWGRPHRPDSFLLISAGYDGLYGTKDDVCNFEPNIE